MQAKELLLTWLKNGLPPSSYKWMIDKCERIVANESASLIYTSFNSVSRYAGKDLITLSPSDQDSAKRWIKGWRPEYWTLCDAIRTLFILSIPIKASGNVSAILDELTETADVSESVSLVKALAILPDGPLHIYRATLAARSNIKPVFEALAHYNPYPSLFFDENNWNQMVLKCLFIESPLSKVYGFDDRANTLLKDKFLGYANERRAAGRNVSPDLWRCVGLFATENELDSIAIAFNSENPAEKQGAALALSSSAHKKAQNILEKDKSMQSMLDLIHSKKLTWDNFDF